MTEPRALTQSEIAEFIGRIVLENLALSKEVEMLRNAPAPEVPPTNGHVHTEVRTE